MLLPESKALERMLADLRGHLSTPEHIGALYPNSTSLAGMLGELRDRIPEPAGNPWKAAILHWDEVRNSSVLAWFLDPKGGHGLGDAPLRAVLNRIAQQIPSFPTAPSQACFVAVEDCPDGLRESRIDVTIDDPKQFFLGIEVKIKAQEQPKQLERYCHIAKERACGQRPWAIVFLTPNGRKPSTVKDTSGIIPMSWREMAAALKMATTTASSRNDTQKAIANSLAKSFATHISQF